MSPYRLCVSGCSDCPVVLQYQIWLYHHVFFFNFRTRIVQTLLLLRC
jgi:hypothetical protein